MLASLLRTVALAGCAATAVLVAQSPAFAEGARCSDDGTVHRECTLPLNKSLILDLPRDAFDVLVSNPAIADAVVRTPRRIYLTGVAVGQTNLFVFDRDGNVIVSLELAVERDIDGLEATLARLIPGSAITVEMINDNIILSGTVQAAADAARASEIAGIFANGGANSTSASAQAAAAPADPNAASNPFLSRIVNLLTIEGEDQVHLRVTIAEVQRDTVKQLGIDWGLQNVGIGNLNLDNDLTGVFANAETFITSSAGGLQNAVQMLETQGLVRTLAEPNLTAISGESATFLAGGEFPIVVGTDRDTGFPIIEYKPFGVSLAFTPIVLSEGRINLHIATEVSEITGTEGALAVRRAETTLELPSGGSMVMSGLLQDNVDQSLEGLPGVRDLPVIGALFGSREFRRNETELVIIVTPYMVQPVPRSALARPDDGFNPATDAAGMFLGQLNRRYGVLDESALRGSYQGNVGFIFE